MSTPSQIATKVLRRIGLLDATESPSAVDDAHVSAVLYDELASLEAQGLSLTSEDLPLPAKYEAALVAIMAERVAGDYGRPIDPILARDAERGRHALFGGYFDVPSAVYDDALINIPIERADVTET